MNPELQRNLWLEYSHYRVIVMPLILGMLFYSIYMITDMTDITDKAVLFISKWLFVLFTIVWGSRQLSDALLEEIRQHTWDWQRISSISPWSLLWGKWLGATIYSWYGGIICLLFAFSALPMPINERFIWLISLVCCALIAQGISLLICFKMFKRDRELRRFRNHIALFIGVSIGVFFVTVIDYSQYLVSWYGISLDDHTTNIWFIMCSLLSFSAWIILGNYRLIAAELQIYSGVLPWLFFMIFVLFYVSGGSIIMAYIMGMAWLFLMLILEGTRPTMLRSILCVIKQSQWQTCAQYMPCWMIGIFPMGIYVLALIFMIDESSFTSISLAIDGHLNVFYVALLLFFIRDVLVISLLQEARRKNVNRDVSVIIYLVIMYWLLPTLLIIMGLEVIIALLTPSFFSFLNNPLISCLSAIIQIIVLSIILLPHICHSKADKTIY